MEYGDEQEEFELIPEGVYGCNLVDSDADLTKDKPWVNTEWVVCTGDFEGRKLWKRFYFTDNTLKFNQWQLGILGIWSQLKESGGDHIKAAEIAQGNIYDMVGQGNVYADMKVSHSTYQGKTREDCIIDAMTTKEMAMTEVTEAPSLDTDDDFPADM